MTRPTIPQSGDFMRLFARTPMTGAALRIANALAGHISYDGAFRGAPMGCAAFTMSELQAITALSERAVRAALEELAALFGLTIRRRHHARHWFRFSKLSPAKNPLDPDTTDRSKDTKQPTKPVALDGVTGTGVPPSLYTKKTRNNDTVSTVKISEGEGSVYQTPFAAVIDSAKKGTAAEKMDTQFLWRGFQMLNRRNNHSSTPLSWLVAFVRKAQPRCGPASVSKPSLPNATVPPRTDPVDRMARAAPYANHNFHESDLRRLVGPSGYDARIAAIQNRYGASRFAARLAVHGQAVREGIIQP